MGERQTNEAEPLVPGAGARPVSMLRYRPLKVTARDGRDGPLASPLSKTARVGLWEELRELLFGLGSSATLEKVWAAPPLGGLAGQAPADLDSVLERWVMLVEPVDVYQLIETVHDAIEPSARLSFVANVNALLDHADAGYRFILRRLVPFATGSDNAAIERALGACKAASWTDVADLLGSSIDELGSKPEARINEALAHATRAARRAASLVTGTAYLELVDALADLQSRGVIGPPLRAAYEGIDAYAGHSVRRTSLDEGRLVVVTCAALITHLAGRH